MNVILFFFLQPFIGYSSRSDQCSCYYDIVKGQTICDLNCAEELVEEDRFFRKCPSQRFKQRLPLWQWLFDEMFCILKDNRKDESQTYSTSSTINYQLPSSFPSQSTDSPGNSVVFKSLIYLSDNTTFQYPTTSLSSSDCSNLANSKYMIPSSSTCYYNKTNTENNQIQQFIEKLLNESITINPANISFNCTCYNQSGVLPGCHDRNYSSVNIVFKFDPSDYTNITAAEVELIEASSEEISPFTVNINYVSETSSTNMKSGPFGYAYGQPVILYKDENSSQPFPVPYGIDSETHYTPLLFGVDTITGFPTGTGTDWITSNYLYISRVADASAGDWLHILPLSSTPSGNMIYLKIYYAFIGNVDNPQNYIYDADLQYDTIQNLPPGQWLFKCAFLKTSNNPSYRYLQPRPRIKGIPSDTFYPF